MALYLEQYFDGLQALPNDLSSNLTQLRSMDEQCIRTLQQADKMIRVYMRAGKTLAPSVRKER
jgi:hypothetical protein